MVRTKLFLWALILALLLPVLAAAEPAVYKVDADHSGVSFSIRHFVSNVSGRFRDFDGVIKYDKSNPAASSVEFTVKTASIDTTNNDRDEHLRSKDFFDVQKFPSLTFTSTQVAAKDGTTSGGDRQPDPARRHPPGHFSRFAPGHCKDAERRESRLRGLLQDRPKRVRDPLEQRSRLRAGTGGRGEDHDRDRGESAGGGREVRQGIPFRDERDALRSRANDQLLLSSPSSSGWGRGESPSAAGAGYSTMSKG